MNGDAIRIGEFAGGAPTSTTKDVKLAYKNWLAKRGFKDHHLGMARIPSKFKYGKNTKSE